MAKGYLLEQGQNGEVRQGRAIGMHLRVHGRGLLQGTALACAGGRCKMAVGCAAEEAPACGRGARGAAQTKCRACTWGERCEREWGDAFLMVLQGS